MMYCSNIMSVVDFVILWQFSDRSNCSDGDMRLMNGTTMFEGRVELCYHGMWGLVCDNTWDSNDAAAACRLLGFPQEGMIIFVL